MLTITNYVERHQAGIASRESPDQLLIALEPEAASIYVRRQRLRRLIPESERPLALFKRETTPEPIWVESKLSRGSDDSSRGKHLVMFTVNSCNV